MNYKLFNIMKKVVLMLLVLPLVLGCESIGTNSKKNLALIDKYIQAVENLDYETMASCLDENYLGLGPSRSDSITKPEAVENWKNVVENLYESIKYKRSRNITANITTGDNQGEWVSNWAELEITYKGDGETVTIWANTIYQIENEKIVKSYTLYNEADVLEQLGYVFIDLYD
jgi:hypothetical protein